MKIRLPFLRLRCPENWKNPFYNSTLSYRQILKRDRLFRLFAERHFKIAELCHRAYSDEKLDFENSRCAYLMAKRDFHHVRWKFWVEKRNVFLERVGHGQFSVSM